MAFSRASLTGNFDRHRRRRRIGFNDPSPDPVHFVRRSNGEMLLRDPEQEKTIRCGKVRAQISMVHPDFH